MIKTDTLALFDFDGTITRKDTFIAFIKTTHSTFQYWLGIGLLSPMLVLYFLKLIRNDKAKAIMFKYYFGGWHYDKFKNAGEDFCQNHLPSMLRKDAIEKIKFHQDKKHRVILVTASGQEWVAPWCSVMGIEILGTKLEVINNRITGKFASANCYGPEKANRIRELLNIEDYSAIYAYGDSKGDREMLALAQHPHYKPFNL